MSIDNQVLVLKSAGNKTSIKKPYLITANYYAPRSLLIFSLIDCENKFFTLRQSRKHTLVVEEFPKSYFTPFICTSISVNMHKVS